MFDACSNRGSQTENMSNKGYRLAELFATAFWSSLALYSINVVMIKRWRCLTLGSTKCHLS